jgi:hypothetical protein
MYGFLGSDVFSTPLLKARKQSGKMGYLGHQPGFYFGIF